MANSPLSKLIRPRIFYGWWIIAAGAVAMSIASGVNFHGFGNFIIPLSEEFGWSYATISIVFSLARLENGMIGPIEGWAVDRLGPRRLMLIGLPLMGVGYIFMGRVDSLLAFMCVYVFLIALGNSLGMSTPINAAAANWFNRKRGLAFGIMWSGVGVGGLLVPALGWCVNEFGWRMAATIVGFGIIVVGIPIALVMRHRPEQYGYRPDGGRLEESPVNLKSQSDRPAYLPNDYTAKEALQTSSFWYLSLSITARSLVSGGIGLHLVPFFVNLGASNVGAATLAGSVGLMSIPGRLGLSTLGDYVNRRYVMVGCLGVMAVAIILMARADNVRQVIPILVVFAASQGGITVIPQSLIAEYFGRRSYATIQGFRSSIQMFGIMVGPVVSGMVYDATGSYSGAFLGFSGAALLSMVLVFLARPPNRRSHRQ